MQIKIKLVLGFLIVVLMIILIGYVSYLQLSEISRPLSGEIPQSIEIVKNTSRLDSLAQFIRYYDEVLTQSARNYAFTQDKKWEERYRGVEPDLDAIIKEAIEEGDDIEKEFFSSVDAANKALVVMEYSAIDYVSNGQPADAIKILDSKEYWDQKKIYSDGLIDYISRRGAEYDQALLASTSVIESSTERTRNLLEYAQFMNVSLIIAALIIAMLVGFLISNSIVRPLTKIRDFANRISRGDLGEQIEIRSKDEIGELAGAFDDMRYSLKMVIDEYEKKKSKEDVVQMLADTTKEVEHVQKEMKDKERFFRSLIEHSWDGIILTDAKTRIIYASPSIKRILGYSPKELIGQDGMMRVYKGDLKMVTKLSEKLLATPGLTVTAKLRYKHKDGSWVWLESTATNLLKDPAVNAIVSNLREMKKKR